MKSLKDLSMIVPLMPKFGDENWELNDAILNSHPMHFANNWKPGKLLEAGCGVGNYIVVLAQRGHKVTGLEYDKRRLNSAKKNLQKYKIKAKLTPGDVRNLPFKNEMFNYVFSHGVVEHFPETEKALHELHRVMKQNGRAMISVPNRLTSFVLFKLIQQALGIWEVGYERSFTIWQFRKMLEKNGFDVIGERMSEVKPGVRFKLIGRILQLIDKPLWWVGIGGHFMIFHCKKK